MEKMKKVLSIIMAVLLVFLLVSCGTADKPSEGKSSKTSEKTDKSFSDFSDSEKKQAFKDYLSSYSGQSDLTSQLISKSPKGTTSISNLTVTTIEKSHGSSVDQTYNFSGSFYAIDKYGTVLDRCTFDASGHVSEWAGKLKGALWSGVKVYS